MDQIRLHRIGDEIQRIVGQLLVTEVNDPRLQFLSITSVDLSSDLSYAKIFYSSVEEKFNLTKTKEALAKASGFFRKRLAAEIDLRITPKLQFIYDSSLREGQRMSILIDAALAKDRSPS